MEIVARITSDARIATTRSGQENVSFTVAINDYYRPKNGEGVQLTTFVRCTYWANTRIASYLLKGVLVQLRGRLGVEAFISKSGEAVGVITCRLDSIKLLSRQRAGTYQEQGAAAAAVNDDDLPF